MILNMAMSLQYFAFKFGSVFASAVECVLVIYSVDTFDLYMSLSACFHLHRYLASLHYFHWSSGLQWSFVLLHLISHPITA